MRFIDIGKNLHIDLDRLIAFGFDPYSTPSEPRYFCQLFDRFYVYIDNDQYINLKREIDKIKEVKK